MKKGSKNSLKWVSLIVLIAQTTALVLILRYSRTQQAIDGGPKYLSSTAVLMAEIVKFITCIVVLLYQNNWSFVQFCSELDADVFQKINDSLKVGVPALLYVIFFIEEYKIKIFSTRLCKTTCYSLPYPN